VLASIGANLGGRLAPSGYGAPSAAGAARTETSPDAELLAVGQRVLEAVEAHGAAPADLLGFTSRVAGVASPRLRLHVRIEGGVSADELRLLQSGVENGIHDFILASQADVDRVESGADAAILIASERIVAHAVLDSESPIPVLGLCQNPGRGIVHARRESPEARPETGSCRPDINQVGDLVHDFLLDTFDGIVKRRGTLSSVEVLIGQLSSLLARRDALARELARAYGDLDVAEARIRELEGVLAVITDERYRTKRHANKKVLGSLAMVVATILGPIAAVVADHTLDKPVKETVEAADQVIVDCGETTVDVGAPNVSIELSLDTLPASE
jgi:hypothetical protein